MPVVHPPTTDVWDSMVQDWSNGKSQGEGLALSVKDLRFAYPDGHVALHGVSLALEQGEKVALVGPNGAGKSTLMLHLNGILGAPADGIIVDGLALWYFIY